VQALTFTFRTVFSIAVAPRDMLEVARIREYALCAYVYYRGR